MARRERRTFTRDFKAEAVRLCRAGGRSIDAVARELDLTPTALRAWVKQAEVDAGAGESGALTKAERTELQQLRRENKQLTMEREFLKQASAFFARETASRLR